MARQRGHTQRTGPGTEAHSPVRCRTARVECLISEWSAVIGQEAKGQCGRAERRETKTSISTRRERGRRKLVLSPSFHLSKREIALFFSFFSFFLFFPIPPSSLSPTLTPQTLSKMNAQVRHSPLRPLFFFFSFCSLLSHFSHSGQKAIRQHSPLQTGQQQDADRQTPFQQGSNYQSKRESAVSLPSAHQGDPHPTTNLTGGWIAFSSPWSRTHR